jgi:hypothetical protein
LVSANGSPLDDSVSGVFRGQNISLHQAIHFALIQKNTPPTSHSRERGAGRWIRIN